MSNRAPNREAAGFRRFRGVTVIRHEAGGALHLGCAALLAIAAAASLAGCAPWARQEDSLLSEAGFTRMRPQMAQGAVASESLPPYQFAHRSVNGVETVLYYDPSGCRCVYSGTPQNYAQFNRNFYELEFERAHSGGP